MKQLKNCLIIFALLFAWIGFAKSSDNLNLEPEADEFLLQLAEKQLMQVVNFQTLSDTQKQYWKNRIFTLLKRINALQTTDENKVLPTDLLQIPTHLIRIAQANNEINMIGDLDIAFIPDPDLLYLTYLKYYETKLKYGNSTPTPEIVLAMMSYETKFLWITGDHGESIAPCQLHSETASWLMNHPKWKSTFSKYFYFANNNLQQNHRFRSKESMIEFIYIFLVQIKGYTAGKEIDAIAKYNGCKPTDSYAINVAKNSVKYIAYNELKSKQYGSEFLTDNEVRQRIKDIADLAFGKTKPKVMQYDSLIFGVENQVNYSYTYTKVRSNENNSFNENTQASVVRNYSKSYFSNLGFGLPYIYKQPDQSLFAYFRGYLSEIVFHHNRIVTQETGKVQNFDGKLDPDFIYLYYETTNPANGQIQKTFITDETAYKSVAQSFAIKTNFEQGKVYIKPGIPIYHYENIAYNLPPSFFVDKVEISKLIDENFNE